MKIYTEYGLDFDNNRFGLGRSVELEFDDGTEIRSHEKHTFITKEYYIRIWMLKTVFVLGTKGFDIRRKNRFNFKIVFGIEGIPYMCFREKVYEVLKQIPKGKVTTYGCIASKIGHPFASRAVGYALHHNPKPVEIPCHRVVFKNGQLSPSFRFGGIERQAELLRGEGIEISDDFKADMTRYEWKG